MSFLCNNVAAFAVAMVASVLVWLFGGTRGDLLTPVAPWLIVFLVEVIFCFPQRHRYESIYDARERVWKTLKRDPAVWVSLGLLALLLVPFLNNGLCPLCDDKAIGQGLDPEPPVPIIPFCVNRLDHLNVVFWFALALPAMVAVRDGLTRRGKRLVLELIVWNGVAVAVLGFVQGAMDAPGPFWSSLPNGRQASDFFATFGYPNMAGCFFMLAFALSRREYVLRKFITTVMVLTMYVNAGLIPNYLLISRTLSLSKSYWVYIIPTMFSCFNMIVIRTYIGGLPDALVESARIDGAGDIRVFWQIIFPLCMPVLATVALFVAVGSWNSWFDTHLYNAGKKNLHSLQYLLKMKLATTQASANAAKSSAEALASTTQTTPVTIRCAITVISTVPILIVYPFLQKYFVTGMALGSVKG